MPRRKSAPSKEAVLIALGKAIREIRMRAGMTIRAVDVASGIEERHLSNYERGERGISVYFLFRLARGLNVPASMIVELAETYL